MVKLKSQKHFTHTFFLRKVFLTAFLNLQFDFVIFVERIKIGTKSVRKMLVKFSICCSSRQKKNSTWHKSRQVFQSIFTVFVYEKKKEKEKISLNWRKKHFKVNWSTKLPPMWRMCNSRRQEINLKHFKRCLFASKTCFSL